MLNVSEKNKVIHACLAKNIKITSENQTEAEKAQRAAFLNNVTWPDNYVIKVAFFKEPFKYEGNTENPNYTPEKAIFVKETVEKNLNPLINIRFEWDVPLANSDCRIMFVSERGAWSLLGTQSLDAPKNEPTMNLGWIDDETDYDNIVFKGTGIVILHEFGHLLGMIHEHSRIDASFGWNKEEVYRQLGGPPNNWSKKDCDEQIFQAYKKNEFNGSAYDKYSMMHYFFPSTYFIKDPNLEKITKMSDLDKEWLGKKYPKENKIGQQNPTNKVDKSKNIFKVIATFFWGNTISKILTVLILILLFYYINKELYKKIVADMIVIYQTEYENDETNNMRGFSYTNDGGIHIGWRDLRADDPKLKTSLGRL